MKEILRKSIACNALAVCAFCLCAYFGAFSAYSQDNPVRDTSSKYSFNPQDSTYWPVQELDGVVVVESSGKNKLREGVFSATAIDLKTMIDKISSLNEIVDRSAGVKVRREGGLGSDYNLSINGLSGNSVRYFLDGVPLESKGTGVNLDNIPLNTISRIEIYKGVVPSYLGSDALGGAINIITKKSLKNYLDASVSAGSFHSYTADVAGQAVIPKANIIVRPSVSYKNARNNYVMKGVEVWSEEEQKYVHKDLPRFHDGYQSLIAQLEAGVNDTKWADAFFIGGSYSMIDKELQTGAMQNKVYGKAERHSSAWNVFARYNKRFGKFNANILLSHTGDIHQTIDTAYRKYAWDGSWTKSSGNEINNKAKSWRIYNRPMTVLNAGLEYNININHNVALNYAMDRTGNKRSDKIDTTFEPTNDVIIKHILSLTYTQYLIDRRMLNTFFIKDYINHTEINQKDSPTITGADKIESRAVKNYFGGGVGSRFNIIPELAVKASYEHSIRLPISRELLGNGTTIYPNLALKPESSDNVNLGLFGTISFAQKHIISYEVNGYLRNVDNYIRATVSEREGMMQYENIPAVHIKGMEFELNYMWNKALSVTLNGTLDDARDMKEFKTDGNPSATYLNRVPNRPWMYANADVSYTFNTLFTKKDKLRLGYSFQWVHWFFLNWEAYGDITTKAKIPEQLVSSIGLTYSWAKERFSISLDCNNLFDSTCYDNYMLQKPGRSFFAKFRVFIN